MLWTNRYNGSPDNDDFARRVVFDDADNCYVVGETFGSNNVRDIFAIKYALDGTALWTNRYNGAFVPPVRFYTTMKFANDGAVLWTSRIATPDYQGGNVPQVRADFFDNLIILGGSVGVTDSNVDFTITKLRPDGMPLWTNRFFESSPFRLATVSATAVDASGNFYFTTSSTGPGGTNLDFLTAKYSPEGVRLWSNRFDGDEFLYDYSTSLDVDSAGHVYVTGSSGPEHNPPDLAVVKYVEYIHYTPPPDFVGTDSFTFVATDATGNSVSNTVNITVTAESLWFNPVRSDLRGTNGTRRLHLDGARGNGPVILSASPNLIAWTPIATNTPVDGAVEFLVSPAGLRQFYRAVQNSRQ